MMKQYRHTQIGYFPLILYSGVVLFVGYLNIATDFNPFALASLIIILIVLGIFTRLTVAVDDQMIKIQFGMRVVRKVFLLKDIEAYCVVKNPWVLRLGDKINASGVAFQCFWFLSD